MTEKVNRYVEFHPSYDNDCFVAQVFLQNLNDRGFVQGHPDKIGQYAFARCEKVNVDVEKGDLGLISSPIIYIGNNFGKHYYSSKDHSSVPVDVFEVLEEKGYTLLENVDGGWSQWDGRPEWSDTYIDFTNAEIVDMGELIEQRRSE